MEDNRITIGFELRDENGNHYEASSSFAIYSDIGMDTIYEIGAQLNTFLRQAGYIRDNCYIFMEDVTEEELEALDDFLHQYRKKNQEAQE